MEKLPSIRQENNQKRWKNFIAGLSEETGHCDKGMACEFLMIWIIVLLPKGRPVGHLIQEVQKFAYYDNLKF